MSTDTPTLGRAEILRHLASRLEPQDWILAAWEGGAAAFGRVDRWSDIDLQVIAADERTADVLPLVEEVLEELSPIELCFELPQPTWHGHLQAFYRLRDTVEYLVLDIVVMQEGAERRFLEPERHGRPSVLFDKRRLVVPQPIDPEVWSERVTARVDRLKVVFPLFQFMVTKEINRGNWIEALAFYQAYTLRPLVELVRIRHEPCRHDFYTHYLQHDVPRGVMCELEDLFFVGDVDELERKHERAGHMFAETLAEIETSGLGTGT